ncbi:MAG TPA: hypothetical protein EYQ64_07390 [Gemmatimonadetes bacterium]|nr:hypothetical protein [Gemmatimonadota bacterium]
MLENAILRRTMNTVPRLKDSIRIRRESAERFIVQPTEGGEDLPLSASGYDLLCRMDGVSDEAAVRQAFGERWNTALSKDELTDWIAELDRIDAFVRNSRAIAALRHLALQGIGFRGARAERRGSTREGERRAEVESRAEWFDHAIVLLNNGQVEESTRLFGRFASEEPGDLRLQELARHLKSVVLDDLPPHGERRDLSWAVFDEALADKLYKLPADYLPLFEEAATEVADEVTAPRPSGDEEVA